MAVKKPRKVQPMLAGLSKSLSDLKLPGYMSPKLNGIRCSFHQQLGPLTRKFEPIPNRWVRSHLKKLFKATNYICLDGELIAGDPTRPDIWNRTNSAIMSEAGEPDFTFFVFDLVSEKGFGERYYRLERLVKRWEDDFPFLKLIRHTPVKKLSEVKILEAAYVKLKYEGAMFRSEDGPYKYGRSTTKEGYLMKIKRLKDIEATITGYEEMKQNTNEAKKSKLGYTKRSSHKANKIGKSTLGAFKCEALFPESPGLVPAPVKFRCGTFRGLGAKWRLWAWEHRDELIGEKLLVTYQSLDAKTGKPIFPIGRGIRKDI